MENVKIIYLASDHAAVQLKKDLVDFCRNSFIGVEVLDLGTDTQESCHYPTYASALAKQVQNRKEQAVGILLCGSGIGVSMVANRYKFIRAALCRDVEDARLSREHNNSNVLCLGARNTTRDDACKIVERWMKTSFQGGRHQERIDLFDQLGE